MARFPSKSRLQSVHIHPCLHQASQEERIWELMLKSPRSIDPPNTKYQIPNNLPNALNRQLVTPPPYNVQFHYQEIVNSPTPSHCHQFNLCRLSIKLTPAEPHCALYTNKLPRQNNTQHLSSNPPQSTSSVHKDFQARQHSTRQHTAKLPSHFRVHMAAKLEVRKHEFGHDGGGVRAAK